MQKSETPSYLGGPPTWKGSAEIGVRFPGLVRLALCFSGKRVEERDFPSYTKGFMEETDRKGLMVNDWDNAILTFSLAPVLFQLK